jgi:hypothetical protein
MMASFSRKVRRTGKFVAASLAILSACFSIFSRLAQPARPGHLSTAVASGRKGPGAPLMSELGKFLVVFGAVIAVIGLLLWSGVGRSWIGRLPGDIHYQRGNLRIFFPIGTCLLISVVLSLLAWLFGGRR